MSEKAPPVEHDMFDPEAAAASELESKSKAYENQSAVEAYLRNRARAYKAVFSTNSCTEGDLEFVMLDLAQFCRGFTTTYDDIERRHVLKEGRREVFMRILDHTSLDHNTLMQRYAAANPQQR